MLEIDVDLGALDDLMAVEGAVDGAVMAGLERVAGQAAQIAGRQGGQIYARSIPQTKKGGPLWKRSGALLSELRALTPQRDGEYGLKLVCDLPYAESRHGLGVDWTPRQPAGGVVRENPFFTQTIEIIEPQAEPLFADGFENFMGGLI